MRVGRWESRRKSKFAAVHESAFGTKRTSQKTELMSAFGSKADVRLDVASMETAVALVHIMAWQMVKLSS